IDGYADGKLNVTAVDEKTLEVKLIAPTAYFLELTAALCAAADGLNPFDRKRSSPTRAQAAALLRG
ncbi:MAG: hypothetical protein KH756_09745, partial [Firmicutes bacterium]|nr:hypothetical protein [Bacillota bacterium]